MNKKTTRDLASHVRRVQSCLSSDFNKIASPGLVSKSTLSYRQQILLEKYLVFAKLNLLLALYIGSVSSILF